ncbi:hypothetical protein ACFL12_02165 [Pseudomonadota bacterium]
MTVAASEDAFVELFETARDNFSVSHSDSRDFGALSVSYGVGARLENGTVNLRNDNTVLIKELDIVYDPLNLTLGLDIPSVCVGGGCVWFICLPEICVFESDPDISVPINLDGIVRSEISGSFEIVPRHEADPDRIPGMTDHAAHLAGDPDKWNFYLDPQWLDVDVIDIADTVGTILDRAVDWVVDTLFGWLPGWAQGLVDAILGGLANIVRAILDIGDDVSEWLSDLLNVSLGLFDFIVTLVADYFAKKNPLFGFEEPLPLPIPGTGLIPVLIPVENVSVQVTDTEMVVSADIGS